MYKLSKDYEALWSFVEKGHEPICFVDYKWSDTKTCRDVARIRRLQAFQIDIGVRGMQYGGIAPFFNPQFDSEKYAFIAECNDLNLEWICPEGNNIESKSELERVKQELEVTEKLLEERQKVLDAIPECPVHGKCVPHALEWIEKQKNLS